MGSFRRPVCVAIAFAVALLVTGVLPTVQSTLVGLPGVGGRSLTLDERFGQVAMRVPGFGGMYLSGNTLMVYLTNPASSLRTSMRGRTR
jgi:hypothetical protein